MAFTTREQTFKQCLIDQVQLEPAHEVLDLGCGTGTLSLWLKARVPQAQITGIDGDTKILSIAQKKASQAGLAVRFEHGLSFQLPYLDGVFDRVVSSLFFHHLTRVDKERTISEVLRVLKPGGQLHVADWGKPTSRLMRGLFYPVQWLDGFETTQDNVEGLLPQLFTQGGFQDVKLHEEFSTVYGTLALYQANKPA
jgi:ubiquinone/menaquinone biosynthesis C-methylase UbiE